MYHQPQRNQMPAPPAYYPAMPPQIYCGNDPATFPSPNGHWPLDDGSHGYTYPPVQCHGCCNHNYFPGHFAVRPPYPCHNYAPPAPFYYPSYYPVPQGMYPPVTYFPPLHCNMEPRYEYDKDMLKGDGHRCSEWCQNRLNGERGGNVKIVEEDPEVEKKFNSSLVPFVTKKYPYPVAFLRPNDMKNAEENKNSDDSRSKVLDKKLGAQASENQHQQPFLSNGWFPYDMRRVQSSNQEAEKKNNNQQLEEVAKSHQPPTWGGWFPFDLSKLGSMKQGEEQKGNQHQNDDDKKMNLPFPLFWMPYQPSVTEEEAKPEMATERNESFGDCKIPLQSINFPPEKQTDNEEKPERNIPNEGSSASNTNRVVKIIPVKQLKEEVEEDKRTSSKMEEIKKKPLEEGTNKESSSPRKTSKLPPVCLRVEPLSKRKGANGKSRSPSPPGDKRKAHDVSAIQSPNLKKKGGEEDQSDGSEVAKKRNKSTEGVVDTANGSFRQEDVKLGCESGDNVSHDDTTTNENAKRSNECKEDQTVDCDVAQKASEDLEAKIVATEDESLTTKYMEAEESKKVEFSDAEAATVIQAAYRGFEVRKWEPLKKLKKLAEVKEEAAGIRRRIQALDSSSNVKDYDREKNMTIEMIMSLLLKLDAVQGLHVSIRDVRKSIARELVSLQETLDSSVFVDKSSPALLEQPSGISPKEIPSDLKNEDINIELRKEGDVVEDHDLSKNDSKVSTHVEKCEEQQSHETDSFPNFKEFEKSVARVNRESLVDELKDESDVTSSEFLHGASDSTVMVGCNDEERVDVQSPMEDSSPSNGELGKEMSSFEDVSEEMGIEIPNIFSLGEHKQGPNTYTSNDDHMRSQVSDYAVEESSQEQEAPEEMEEGSQKGKEEEKTAKDSKVEEMIILSQEQEAPEEMQKGNQEGKEGEKIIEDSKSEEIVVTSQPEVPKEMLEGSQKGKEEEKISEDSKLEDMIILSQEHEAPDEIQEGNQKGKEEENIPEDSKDEEIMVTGQEPEAPEETRQGTQKGKEEENFTEDLKGEEMAISSREQEAPEDTQEGSQKGKEEEKIEDLEVEEIVISSREHVATEDMHMGSQEGNVEEKIIDSVFPETVLPLRDSYVDVPIEFPKASENSPDPRDAEPDAGLEQEVDEITGLQKGQVLENGQLEVSSTIHNDEQFGQAELQKEQLESDTGLVSGAEATMLVHEEVSSYINEDLQEGLQKKDQGLGTDTLPESGGCDDGKVVSVTTMEGETGGEEYTHMANICVEEEIKKNVYGLSSGGSQVVPPGVEKSDEIAVDTDVLHPDVGADKIENVGHVVIPAGASDQAEELDITKPSPTGSQASLKSEVVRENDSENNQKLVEENEKLRDMMEKLLEAGSKQLSTISELSSRINDLERRLATKKKKQQRIRRRPNAVRRQGITV